MKKSSLCVSRTHGINAPYGGRTYLPVQLEALGRLPDHSLPGFLLHAEGHGLLGLPDEQVPHGHVVHPLLLHHIFLGLGQTPHHLMTTTQQTQTGERVRG